MLSSRRMTGRPRRERRGRNGAGDRRHLGHRPRHRARWRRTAARCSSLCYRRGRKRARAGGRPVHFDRFFFPLDRIEAWNRLYGRRGFVQYQCVLPRGESAAGLAALLERVAASGQGSFLGVLKLFGPAGEGLMSFPMEGYTLTLDFPVRSGTAALLDGLDEITHRHGGRVYLAKDARCAPERVREAIPTSAPSRRSAPRRLGRRPGSPPSCRGGSRCEGQGHEQDDHAGRRHADGSLARPGRPLPESARGGGGGGGGGG